MMLVQHTAELPEDYDPLSQQWRFRDRRDGEIATYAMGSVTARVDDLDGDFSVWEVSRHDTVIASEGATLEDKVVCDRAGVGLALTVCLSDVALTEPDRGRRADLIENVTAVLRGAAAMPRCEQPREDVEVVSWQ